MAEYRKRPVVVEAFRLGEEYPQWFAEAVGHLRATTHNHNGRYEDDYALIKTLEGTMRAEKGDWIIRGVKGEIYPCKPDIFDLTYEPA